jgi:hypothetical protein
VIMFGGPVTCQRPATGTAGPAGSVMGAKCHRCHHRVKAASWPAVPVARYLWGTARPGRWRGAAAGGGRVLRRPGRWGRTAVPPAEPTPSRIKWSQARRASSAPPGPAGTVRVDWGIPVLSRLMPPPQRRSPRSGRQIPGHVPGSGWSVLAEPPGGTRGKVTKRTYGTVPVLRTSSTSPGRSMNACPALYVVVRHWWPTGE